MSHGSRWQVILFMAVRAYPYEDQCTGVSHFVLPLRHLDHGKLSWTGTPAQNLAHLRGTKQSRSTPTAEKHDTHIREEPDSDPFLFFRSEPPQEMMFSHTSVTKALLVLSAKCQQHNVLWCEEWAVLAARVYEGVESVCASLSCQRFSPSTYWVPRPAPLPH